jgi:hypothetical protein
VNRCARDRPSLIVGAATLALDDDLLTNVQKRQENINVYAVIRQVADVDLGGAGLRSVIPKNVAVAGVARRGPCVGAVQEQA